jgi:hypothetical protein
LIELDVEYWKKYTDKEMPTPEDILNIIELKEIWDDGNTFDFTLPDEITDYVVSVSFNENGEIQDITMES